MQTLTATSTASTDRTTDALGATGADPARRALQATPSRLERWSRLDGVGDLDPTHGSSVIALCESLATEDLVDRPGLLARWARAKAYRGDLADAISTSRIAASLAFEPDLEWFRHGEETFQREVGKRIGSSTPVAGHRAPAPAVDSTEPSEQAMFSIRVLGGLDIRFGDRYIDTTGWGKNKARNLFLALVLEQGRDVPRDLLLERFWPRLTSDIALNNFYVTWNGIKRTLGARGRAGDPPMPVHNAGLRCSMLRDRCRTDLDDFLDAVSAARAARVAGDARGALLLYREVAHIYRGDVLPGDVAAEWIAPYREAFHTQFLDAMASAGRVAIDCGEPEEASWFANRGLRTDGEREALFELVVEASIETGRRDEGIRAYMRCRNMLAEEYGLDPSSRLQELYQRLLSMEV